MYDDFILGGPAIAMAAVYLAPNANRRRLLKGLRSADREKAIRGVRNAAWDLTIISEWATATEKQTELSRLTLLASLDRDIHRTARAIADLQGAAAEGDNVLALFLTKLWGESIGPKLASEVLNFYSSRERPDRQINRVAPTGFIDSCILRGESRLREWSPSRVNT
jgi:hypothetical protein